MKILLWYLGKVKVNDIFGFRNIIKLIIFVEYLFVKINIRRLI